MVYGAVTEIRHFLKTIYLNNKKKTLTWSVSGHQFIRKKYLNFMVLTLKT